MPKLKSLTKFYTCKVCHGSGTLKTYSQLAMSNPPTLTKKLTCHGCNGLGMILAVDSSLVTIQIVKEPA